MSRTTSASRLVVYLLVALCAWIVLAPQALQATDADRTMANSYDDAWESAWVNHLKSIKTAQGGSHTAGFVIHIGDSITYANQYANHFAAAGGHVNATDVATIAWSKAGDSDTSSPLPNNKNGWNLAKYDHPAVGRSFTASSGITSGQWLVGGGSHGIASGNGSTADPNPVDTLLANTSTAPYPSGSTVAIVKDAQVVIIMLGTNDIGSSIATATIKANLQSIITKFENANIMVVLSTIPPRVGKEAEAIAVNTEIKNLCIANNLPMIDFHSEIMRRRPGTTWQGTLIQGDGIHPTFGGGAFVDPDNDPTALDNNGYELRGFLSIQKLQEIKYYVIDGNPLPASGPTITTQPSNVTVTVGSSATFTVAATGTGTLSYQWKKGSTPVGTNSATYTIGSTVAGDAGSYSVVVTDTNGSTTSNTVTLTVNTPPPTISTHPGSLTVNAGNSATFTVVASGSGLSYQWKKGSTPVGTNSATYTIGSTVTGDAGNYTVVVTNAGGSVTSNIAVLTVIGPPTITTHPSSTSVVAGSTATFTVTASGSGTLTYQWQLNSANISLATSASYTTPATVIGDNGNQYRCIVTNSAGSATSNQATLTVTASAVAPTITTQPANQTVTSGATATFSVVASGTAPFTYQWQKNGTDILGATGATYTTPGTTSADNLAQYRVVVTNAGGNVTSNAAVLTVTTGANPISPSTLSVTFAAAVGSTTPVITTVVLTNSTGGPITVTPTTTAGWLTLGGAVTVPGGSTATLTLTGDPSGLTGVAGGTLVLTNSTGGSQTLPVSFTIGVNAGLRKRSCAIGTQPNADLLAWLTGLSLLAGLSLYRRRQNTAQA